MKALNRTARRVGSRLRGCGVSDNHRSPLLVPRTVAAAQAPLHCPGNASIEKKKTEKDNTAAFHREKLV